MPIRGDTHYVLTTVNMIVLQGEDGACYYLHRSLYDQCVVPRDRYVGLTPSLYRLLGFEGEYPKAYDTFMESASEPLDILAPFLGIITNRERLDNIDGMCGAISSMSVSVDFRKIFKVSATVRVPIKFGLSACKKYRVQRDCSFVETPTFERVYSGEVHTVRLAPIGSTEDSVDVIEEGGEAAEINYAGGAYNMDDLMRMLDAASEAAEEEGEFGGSSTTEEVIEERSKMKNGFVMLKGLK